ncbi:cytochrome b5 domain-containing protein [Schleiferilactobacillus shenzhenensis]|uniref:Cytochrome b5 heme-binding domain-containing protein n=1 Tax=Schleiferilactobacillus shenzhenensis LY-73 TaxID=1231336 RepID=U4TM02_9LACO|nr:cytochrome b5 domain-containing protein [Schleiferilactobacillus shenzhenensis]ERL64425.1 hypothetical protein L248_0967 [Schleiferilactobacillus shenzhenensis LY-73]
MAEKTFTKEELAQYDGIDGRKAYVAIDGTVYDVTNVKQWTDGYHHGHDAGEDLSAVIDHSPHKHTVLEHLPVVGKYTG